MAGTIPLKSNIKVRSRLRARLVCLCACSVLVLSACGDKGASMSKGADDKEIKTTSHINSADPDLKLDRGMNPKNIFGANLRSDSERMDRLERAVQKMRNEFDSVRPSIRRLMAIEADIQNLIGELKKMTEDTAMAATPAPMVERTPPPQAAAKKSPAQKMATKKAPPVQNGKASVYDVRIGEHPGKTRIVLDVNAKARFSTDIDNSERIMIVELPDASWGTSSSKNFSRSPHLASYKTESAGNGTMLIFQLRKAAKITYKDDLPSNSGSGRRIVIDLSSN